MLKKIVTAVALVSACGLASSAMAAKAKPHGFYVDGYLGVNRSSVASTLTDNHLQQKTYSNTNNHLHKNHEA
jgi:hypothetical protein